MEVEDRYFKLIYATRRTLFLCDGQTVYLSLTMDILELNSIRRRHFNDKVKEYVMYSPYVKEVFDYQFPTAAACNTVAFSSCDG